MLFSPGKYKLDITIDSQQIPQVKETRFLGVTLDDELNWKVHISHVRDKLLVNKHLPQLGRNLLNKQSLLGIYYAHVYSHLTYSLNTWVSMFTKTQINDLFKIQKACIYIVHEKPTQLDCMEILHSSKLLTFQELIDLESIKYGHRISKGLTPKPIQRIMQSTRGLKTHSYNTRNKSTPNIQKHQTVQFNRSFLCHSISNYNKLPGSLKTIKMIHSFTRKAKVDLLNQRQPN